jgi:hypothetical protein
MVRICGNAGSGGGCARFVEQGPAVLPVGQGRIARLSELVLRLGHEPRELVIPPRAELDRHGLTDYGAGWADVVDEQLPAVRQAYGQRVTAACLQGQEDACAAAGRGGPGGPRPRGRGSEGTAAR